MQKTVIAFIVAFHFLSFSSANSETLSSRNLPQRAPLPPQFLDAVKKKVDPEGKMTEAQRNMYALGAVYRDQMNKNNPEGVARVALQILQAYRLDVQRYANIAAHAAEAGDLSTAAQAAMKSYANIPDGRDVKIFKRDDGQLNYYYTDGRTGERIQKGVLTPKELAAHATGIAAGVFEKLIYESASLPLPPQPASAKRRLDPMIVFPDPDSHADSASSNPRGVPSAGNLPSINCVTMKEVYGTGSTTHCHAQ